MSSTTTSLSPNGRPKRLNKVDARAALPEELRPVFDQLCEETLHWSQYYYGSNLISYSIIKELVDCGWRRLPFPGA
jgi:hypothetical protein